MQRNVKNMATFGDWFNKAGRDGACVPLINSFLSF